MRSRRLGALVMLNLTIVMVGCGPSETIRPPTTTASEMQSELSVSRARTVAVDACEALRGWVNAVVAEMNEASSEAAEAGTPTGVRDAFSRAILDVEVLLEEWPGVVNETVEGDEQVVASLRSDLIGRSDVASVVLAEMGEVVAAWPDDDPETRNARTQQAFIRFEAVMAEMRPDLGPYSGTRLGDALASEELCELTIRP